MRGAPWTDSQAIIAAALSVGGRTLPGIGTTSTARPGPGGRSSVMARRRPRQPWTGCSTLGPSRSLSAWVRPRGPSLARVRHQGLDTGTRPTSITSRSPARRRFATSREQGLCGEVHPDGRGTGIPDHTLEQLRGATVASPATTRALLLERRRLSPPTASTRARCSVQPPWHIAVFTDQVSGQPVLGHRLRRTHRLRLRRNRRPRPRVLPRQSPTVTTSRCVSGVSKRGGENSAAAGAWWVSTRKGLVWVVADPAGRTSASEPKATEARPRRGAELEAMIETRGA